MPADTEWLALALEQTREIMKRCDQLINRAEREISKFASIQDQRPHLAACVRHKAGRFNQRRKTEPSSLRRIVANLN